MDFKHKKPIIGILGGISSGKTTLANLFTRQNASLIDADKIARQVTDKPNIINSITKAFGNEVLDPKGKLDRKKLAKIVFQDKILTDKLNKIVHPEVLNEIEQKILEFLDDSKTKIIVLDIPLLLEIGWEKKCDILVFIHCNQELRLKRAAQRGVASGEDLKNRENLQISLDKKRDIADYIVNNNSKESAMAEQVQEIINKILS